MATVLDLHHCRNSILVLGLMDNLGGEGGTACDFFKPVSYKREVFEESMTYGKPSDFSLEEALMLKNATEQ